MANQHTAWHAKFFVLIALSQYLQSALSGVKKSIRTSDIFLACFIQSAGPITTIINKANTVFQKPSPPLERVKILLILVWSVKC